MPYGTISYIHRERDNWSWCCFIGAVTNISCLFTCSSPSVHVHIYMHTYIYMHVPIYIHRYKSIIEFHVDRWFPWASSLRTHRLMILGVKFAVGPTTPPPSASERIRSKLSWAQAFGTRSYFWFSRLYLVLPFCIFQFALVYFLLAIVFWFLLVPILRARVYFFVKNWWKIVDFKI